MKKVLYLETRRKFNLKDINFNALDTIPGKTISLTATIQYLDLIPAVKKYLESKGKKVIIKRGPVYAGQVLGCNPIAFSKESDTLLLVTDGKFHALNNALQLDREIYVFNTHNLELLTLEDIAKFKLKKRGALNKFLQADKVGILVSTKFGQNKDYTIINSVKKKLEKKNKKVYIFESDNINLQELENFQIPIYINTACFGLGLDDSRIINLQDILEFL